MDFCYYCDSMIYPDDEVVSVPDALANAHIECSEDHADQDLRQQADELEASDAQTYTGDD